MRGTWTVVTLPKDLRRFGHNLSPPSPIRAIPICGSTSTASIPFRVIDLRAEPAALEYVTERLGYAEAPVVVVDQDSEFHWSGFRPDVITQLAQRVVPDAPPSTPRPAHGLGLR